MKTLIHRVHLNIFADYNQFYLLDALASAEAPTDWTDKDIKNRIKVTRNLVVICPVRNMTVPVDIEIHDSDPFFHLSEWQHVVEGSFSIDSGKLEVHECTGGSHALFTVDPGFYRIRGLYSGLDTLSEDGLEGNDRYLITLWKGNELQLRVLKCHDDPA